MCRQGSGQGQFFQALLLLLRGQSSVDPLLRQRLQDPHRPLAAVAGPPLELSARERELLLAVARGHSSAEIAALQRVRSDSVRRALCALYRRVGVRNQRGLIAWALEQGLLRPPDLQAPPRPQEPAAMGNGRRSRAAGHSTSPRPRMDGAQRAFARQHLGLAHQQAQRFARRHGLDPDDLLGPAYEGLCKAAIGFDPALGHRPSSYIVPKVKGELLHHLRDTGFALRISHRLRELWMKARRPLALGCSDQQIADQLGVALAVWLDCRQACGLRPLPLEELERRGR